MLYAAVGFFCSFRYFSGGKIFENSIQQLTTIKKNRSK
jgi:hypothetical protein